MVAHGTCMVTLNHMYRATKWSWNEYTPQEKVHAVIGMFKVMETPTEITHAYFWRNRMMDELTIEERKVDE